MHILHITFAIDPPVTMKAERLEAVFRSKPATMDNMGIKRPPPPIPPALEIAEAMKHKTPARTKGPEISIWDCASPPHR